MKGNFKKGVISGLLIVTAILLVIIVIANSKNTIAYDPVTPHWLKITKTFSDFSTAGLTNNIEVYSLPAKAVIHSIIMKPTTVFSGGTIATYSISVGRTGVLDYFMLGADMKSSASSTTFYNSETFPQPMDFSSVASIRAQAISTVGNLNTATQGSADFYLLISNLP